MLASFSITYNLDLFLHPDLGLDIDRCLDLDIGHNIDFRGDIDVDFDLAFDFGIDWCAQETTTLGVRVCGCERVSLQKVREPAFTPWGWVPVSAAYLDNQLVSITNIF